MNGYEGTKNEWNRCNVYSLGDNADPNRSKMVVMEDYGDGIVRVAEYDEVLERWVSFNRSVTSLSRERESGDLDYLPGEELDLGKIESEVRR